MKSGTMKMLPHALDMQSIRRLYGHHHTIVSTPNISSPAKKRKYQKRKPVKSGKKLLPKTRNRIQKKKTTAKTTRKTSTKTTRKLKTGSPKTPIRNRRSTIKRKRTKKSAHSASSTRRSNIKDIFQ